MWSQVSLFWETYKVDYSLTKKPFEDADTWILEEKREQLFLVICNFCRICRHACKYEHIDGIVGIALGGIDTNAWKRKRSKKIDILSHDIYRINIK